MMRVRRELMAALWVTVLGCTCESPSQRPASAQPTTPPPEVRERLLDPAVAQVEPGSDLGRARRALDADRPGEALRIATAALGGDGPAAVQGRLRWVAAAAADAAAQAATEEGEQRRLAASAEEHWRALAESDHPLSRWATLRLAEHLADEDPAEAARIAAPLGEGWAGAETARTVEALALARAGEHDRAVPALRALVEATPDHVGAATAGMPLAEILAARDDVASREEALALYRRVATRAPLARVGQQAAERAEQVLASLPPERREALAPVPMADRLARAEAFYNSMNHERAEEAYEELVRVIDDPGRRCHARLMQGRAMLRQRERDRGARHMEQLAEDCDGDVRAWALYYAARAHARRGRDERAMELYARLEQEAPDHRLADDALFKAALSALEEGDEAGMVERLSRVPDRYPDGDMRSDARFLLAWRARAAEDWELALEHLDASLAEGPDEHAEDIRGRVAYWRARTLADAGRTGEAHAAYEALAREWPLSYYAQQAVARLDETAPERAEAIRETWRDDDAEPLIFPWRGEFAEPSFETALELVRVGEVDLAEDELEHMGAIGEGADPDMLWAVAAVLHRAGAYPQASLLVRRRLSSFMETAPTGRARHMWRIAYPHAFSPLIDDAAADAGVPPAFVRAVAREESAFDPRAVSVANAYGLIQLIQPTARRFARDLGLPSDPGSLRRAEINIPIGTAFIAFLWERYESNPAVVPSAYNAGEGATDRWLRERPEEPLDVWVENIPYDQTRRYTRRVLQTYGVYRWLDDGELPELRRELPPDH